jgi:acyl-CoA dehydrogenase
MGLVSHRPTSLQGEDLLLFRDSVRRFLSVHATREHMDTWRRAGIVPRSFWTAVAETGFLGMSLPERYGGAGVDFRFDMGFVEELAAIGLESFGAPMHNSVVAPYIETFGSEEQKQRWLPKMVTGELIGAIAMSEPGAGSDLRGVRTTARRDGDEYVLNGQKTYITNGQTANLIAVIAKTSDGGDGPAKPSIVFVETDRVAGFSRGRNLEKVGMDLADTSELFFSDVRVPAANLLGEEGSGMRQLMAQLPQERLIIAVQGIAAAERALGLTIDYVKQRRAFGQAIIEFQNTQFKLAECKTEVTIARVFVDHCLDRHLRGELDSVTASMAKYWVTDLQCRVIDECLQLHGGAGYMLEYPIAQMYRDARAQRIYGGTNEIMKVLIARGL